MEGGGKVGEIGGTSGGEDDFRREGGTGRGREGREERERGREGERTGKGEREGGGMKE